MLSTLWWRRHCKETWQGLSPHREEFRGIWRDDACNTSEHKQLRSFVILLWHLQALWHFGVLCDHSPSWWFRSQIWTLEKWVSTKIFRNIRKMSPDKDIEEDLFSANLCTSDHWLANQDETRFASAADYWSNIMLTLTKMVMMRKSLLITMMMKVMMTIAMMMVIMLLIAIYILWCSSVCL